MAGIEDLKQIQRAMWAAGDYLRIADLMAPPCIELVRKLEIEQGMLMADIACGSGNVAIAAAERGALVIGVDLTPENFPAGMARAAEAGVLIDWREGDAERLDLPSAGFDRVTSTFGSQFAPQHQAVANEMARICKPGGVIGMCNWTERGWTGQFQQLLASYFPEPEVQSPSPMLWGEEEYVTALFADTDIELSFRIDSVPYQFQTAEHMIRFFEANFGPFVTARNVISPRSRWNELRADLVDLTEAFNVENASTGLLVEAEYLEVIGRKPAVA